MTTTQLSSLGRFEKILIVTDGSKFSAGAEREAIKLARACGSHLYIMSVVKLNPEYDTLVPQVLNKAEQNAIGYMNAVKSKAMEAGIISENVMRYGENIYKEIIDVAEELQIDVIVIGRRGGKLGLMQMMMGDVTAKVIGHAHCHILVAPRTAHIAIKKILLAVDGSRYSDLATSVTAKLAKNLNAQVLAISAVHTEHKESRHEEAEVIIKHVYDFLQQEGISVAGQTVTGRYAEAIVDTGQQNDCNLIVMGSHGRTGLERILVGSVSERVIALAQCAVLVVKS